MQLDHERLHRTFQALDGEGIGYFTVEHLKSIVGVDLSTEDLADLLEGIGADNNTKVDWDRFFDLWKDHLAQSKSRPISDLLKKVAHVTGSRAPPPAR